VKQPPHFGDEDLHKCFSMHYICPSFISYFTKVGVYRNVTLYYAKAKLY